MEKKVKTEELVLEARNFFEYHKKEIGKAARIGGKLILVSFDDLATHSPILAEYLLSSPEEILMVMETALEESGIIKNPRIRITHLPDSHSEEIRNLRAKHLNMFIQIEGIVRQASEVRPQVINARFECPSCGTVISILQIESKFREPTRCSCGRRGGFKILSKDMVDAQRLVIEESPENLTGGEQPRRLSIFLKEDLVEPKMEEKTTPGSKVRILGVLKEIAKHSQSGGQLTRYDIALEANNIIPLEESYEEIIIDEEDERQIKELAADPRLFEKLADSIAPSIYGHKEVKKALILQLFGGVKKQLSDGTFKRGDFHILLVGDPGVAKSIDGDGKIMYHKEKEAGYIEIRELYKRYGPKPKNLTILTINQESHTPEWKKAERIMKHLPERELIKVRTEHGREITATKDHSFITLNEEGKIKSIKGEELTKETYLPIPLSYNLKAIEHISTKKFNTHNTNSRQLPETLELNRELGFFIGIFLSEGNIDAGKSIRIANMKSKIKERVKNYTEMIGLKATSKSKETRINSKSLGNLLKYYCYKGESDRKIKGGYSRIKKIPEFSYFAGEEFIRGILSGIFSGDGRFIKDKKQLKGAELITISKSLAEGTSDLLLSIGIINRIIKRVYNHKGEKTDYYTVQVPKYMLKKFLKEIEFNRKELPHSEPIYSYHDLIPCGNILYELIKKSGFNKRKEGNRTLAAMMRTVKKRNKIGRIRLKKILDMIPENHKTTEEYKTLRIISESKILWSKIEDIQEVVRKTEEVYDISTPRNNTFVSNGIGIHNSAILTFIANSAPKGRYIVGKSTSGAGLTATVVRDEFLRGWSLEAGAMVLANKGIVCITGESCIWMDDKIMTMEELWDSGIPTRNNNKKRFFKYIPSYNHKKKVYENNLLYEVIRTPYKGELVNIKLANGLRIKATPDHKFYASGINTKQPKYKEPIKKIVLAEEIKKGNYLNNFSIPFTKKTLQEDNAYLHGFIYGDGFIDAGGITISQSRNNQHLIDRLIKEFPKAKVYIKKEKEKILKSRDGKDYKMISKDTFVYINDRKLMIKYFEDYSHLQKILKLNEESLCRFLAGIFDSDGSINHLKDKVIALRIYATSNEKETQIIMNGLKRLGINSIKQEYRKNLEEISISSGNDIKIFWEKIGRYSEKLSKEKNPDIRHKIKYGGLKNSFTKVLEVKKEKYEGFVYDINVLNAHNFIANGVLTHNCIDEMDKMDPQDRSAMHEALEQQTVSISKATVQAKLRAETSVLAAANPKFGRFDPYQTVAEQIDMPPTLINRFDIIFILKDIPEKGRDEAIASQILQESKEQVERDTIDRIMLRKYLSYARQRIKPKLTDEAIEEIKKFYVELRNSPTTSDSSNRPLPISARQLEGLIRLSEASAKARLSQKVTREDAKRAVELMKYYLMHVGYDYETKTFDIDRISSGVSSSQRGKIMGVKEALSKLEGRLGKLIPLEELRKELEGKMDDKEIDESLEKLTRAGDVFHPRKGFIQIM